MQNPSAAFHDIVGSAVTLKTEEELLEESEREGLQEQDRKPAETAAREINVQGYGEGEGSARSDKRLYTPDDIDF
jgi:hypothetical protein